MTDRPTCGTCPHHVRYRDSYGCARDTPRGVVVGDTLLAAIPYTPSDYPGCQHHPRMGKWLASLDGAEASGVDQLAELEQWRKALVWYRDSADGTLSLCVTNTGVVLAYVLQTSDGWVVGVVGGGAYQSRADAMRAVEAALGLPKCRVEGEP